MQRYPKNVGLKLKNYGRNCHYCGDELWAKNFTVDHVVPLASGGLDNRDNKVGACRRCNEKKGSLTLQEFRPIFFYMTGYKHFYFEVEWPTQSFVPEHKRRVLYPKGEKRQ